MLFTAYTLLRAKETHDARSSREQYTSPGHSREQHYQERPKARWSLSGRKGGPSGISDPPLDRAKREMERAAACYDDIARYSRPAGLAGRILDSALPTVARYQLAAPLRKGRVVG